MKTIENPTANVANEVVNQSIVTLNEFKNVKLSSISSKKRPEAKENRTLATSVLDNWDNVEVLEKIFFDKEVTNETIKGIVFDRMTSLRAAQGIAKLEEAKAREKEVRLTDNERAVLEALYKSAKETGDSGIEYILENVSAEMKKSAKSVAATIGSLALKGMVKTLNEEDGYYFDGYITEDGIKALEQKVEKSVKKETKQEKKTDKPAKKETFAAKETKKIGDLHKNGKWVWTEYAPGKFDWRTRPELKQRPGAKAKAGEESTKKGKPAKKAASKASTVKYPVKNTETKTSDEPNQKLLTIDEWIALPNKRSIVAKKISDAQKEAFKLIMKGYRLTSDMKFFENGESRKSCNIESVQALFARYGINYLPEGLVK